jgi:hypothetical protein
VPQTGRRSPCRTLDCGQTKTVLPSHTARMVGLPGTRVHQHTVCGPSTTCAVMSRALTELPPTESTRHSRQTRVARHGRARRTDRKDTRQTGLVAARRYLCRKRVGIDVPDLPGCRRLPGSTTSSPPDTIPLSASSPLARA